MAFAVAALWALCAGPVDVERWRPAELRVRPERTTDLEAFKSLAISYLGRPYEAGGVGSPGMDCSGFVCRVFAEAGYPVPRVSRDQAKVGWSVPLDQLAPGDLLLFAERGRPISHVGLYLGDGELIHASSGAGAVVVARLGSHWFQERLVGARRVLGSKTATVTVASELVEHSEDFSLPWTLRRPVRALPPSYGPELWGSELTQFGIRSALASEGGRWGGVWVPEARWVEHRWALAAAVALPIRWDQGGWTVGRFESAADWLRWLRELSVGLPGADFEARLSRFGDLTLLGGFLVRHLIPAHGLRSVPALSVGPPPLTFFTAVRRQGEAELFIDDLARPGMVGAGGRWSIFGPLQVGAAVLSEQRGQVRTGTRAINAMEIEAHWSLLESNRWSLALAARGAGLAALGRQGAGTVLELDLQHRFSAVRALTLEVRGGWLGAGFLDELFGPVYAAYKPEHLLGLGDHGRGVVGGRLQLRWGKLVAAVGYADSWQRATDLDQRVEGALTLGQLSLGGTRWLDLRCVYVARGPFLGKALDVVQGSARLRFGPWLSVDAYVQKGASLEAGVGATLAFLP